MAKSVGKIKSRGKLSFAILFVCCNFAPLAHALDEAQEELNAVNAESRFSVFGLRSKAGLSSCVVIDKKRGLLATSKSRLRGAGKKIHLFAFRSRIIKKEQIDIIELGELLSVAMHEELDLAIVRAKLPPWAKEIPLSTDDDVAKYVSGVLGGIDMKLVYDLTTSRLKKINDRYELPISLNSAGGAVLNSKNELLGIANFSVNSQTRGSFVPTSEINLLLDNQKAASQVEIQKILNTHLLRSSLLRETNVEITKNVTKIAEGVYVQKTPRAIILDGVILHDAPDPLEYLACPLNNGKLYESLVGLIAKPSEINIAMLSIGLLPGNELFERGSSSTPKGQALQILIEWDDAEAIAVGKVAWGKRDYLTWGEISVIKREGKDITWESGKRVCVRAEELLFDLNSASPMQSCSWIYTGSYIDNHPETKKPIYSADQNGVFVATYRDPSAVINIPLKEGSDDESYIIRGTVTPPRGTSMRLILLPVE